MISVLYPEELFTLSQHMPIYYHTYPDNIPDSRSMETMFKDLDDAGFPRVIFITDRGYESLQNLERYILRGQPMIMCVKTGQKMVTDKIDKFGDFSGRPDGMEIDPESRIYYKQYDLDYKVEATTPADRSGRRRPCPSSRPPRRRPGRSAS